MIQNEEDRLSYKHKYYRKIDGRRGLFSNRWGEGGQSEKFRTTVAKEFDLLLVSRRQFLRYEVDTESSRNLVFVTIQIIKEGPM